MAITKVTNSVLANDSVGFAQLSAGAVPRKLTNEIGAINFRNKIINGGFDIWQRGTSFSNFGSLTFTADRWSSGNIASNPTTTSRQTLNPTDLPALEAGLRYFLRMTHGSTAVPLNGGNIATSQGIELTEVGGVAPFKVDRQYTMSFYARCNSVQPLYASLAFQDGHADNALGNQLTIPIPGGVPSSFEPTIPVFWPISTTANWQRFSFTFTMIAPRATSRGLFLGFINGQVPANTNIDITGVQLEEGSFATPFEQRPIGTELALCQRYYEIAGWYYDNASNVTDLIYRVQVPFKQNKRISTWSFTSTANVAVSIPDNYKNPGWCQITISVAGLNEYSGQLAVDAEL
jgi:hypothetical protein